MKLLATAHSLNTSVQSIHESDGGLPITKIGDISHTVSAKIDDSV
jgi:hypothetical protein